MTPFEMPVVATKKPEEDPREKAKLHYDAVRAEYGQMAGDIEEVLNQTNAAEYLNNNSPQTLKELFDDAVSKLEIKPELIPTVTRDVLDAMRSAARKGKFTYEDYSFDAIRKALGEKFQNSSILSVKEKKTARDFD